MYNDGLLKVFIGKSATLTAGDYVGDVLDAGSVSRSRDEVECTRVGDKAKRFEGTLIDEGTQSVKIAVDDSETVSKVEGYFNSAETVYVGCAVEGAPHLSFKFSGFVKSYSIEGYTPGGQFVCNLEIRKNENLGSFTAPTIE